MKDKKTWTCKGCGEKHSTLFSTCWKCSTHRTPQPCERCGKPLTKHALCQECADKAEAARSAEKKKRLLFKGGF